MDKLTVLTTLAQYFLYFIMYSVLGWCIEMLYCGIGDSIKNKKLTIHNRGFLYGPLTPIYGTATTVMLLTLSHFKDNIPLLFIIGLVMCDIVEYLTSFLMEKLFHAHWWDYTGKFLNINGRIDFVHSLEWGALSVVFVRYIHPFFSGLSIFHMFTDRQIRVIALGIFIYFIYDLVNTVIATVNVRNLQTKLASFKDTVTEKLSGSKFNPEEASKAVADMKDRITAMFKGRRTRHVLIEFPDYLKEMMNNVDTIQNNFTGLKEEWKEDWKEEWKTEWDSLKESFSTFLEKHKPRK